MFPFYPDFKAVPSCNGVLSHAAGRMGALDRTSSAGKACLRQDFGFRQNAWTRYGAEYPDSQCFRFTRILKQFLPVTVCSTAMEYLISMTPPRSVRLCFSTLV